jgi:hypothetical protein
MNYTQKISKIASKRRNGDVPRISDVLENNYSTSHITNVLNGVRFNDRIVNAAYRLLYRRESNATKISKLTTKLTETRTMVAAK